MTNRYYICRNPEFPEADLWIEMKSTTCGNSTLQIRGKNENGPVTIICLSMAEVSRMQKIFSEFMEKSSSFLLKCEDESDPLGNH